MKKEEILNLLRSHKKELEKFGVKKIGIFGSFIRGDASSGSDADKGRQ